MALVSPPRGSGSRTPSNKKAKTPGCRKARQDKPSKEEDERRRIRRERNKIAAAKCRSRRRELIDTLQAETEQLEDEKSILQSEIDELLKEKERLEQVLSSHGSSCKLKSKADEDEDEEDMAVPSPKGAGIPAAAILGNSDLFLSASVQDEQEESLQELKDDLDDLIPSLETEGVTSEAAAGAFVPDIADLSAPLCPPDWETLYKSVADDLECLGAPSYGGNHRVGVFSFNLAEMDALAPEGGFEDNLNSPTLLAL